MKKYQPITPGNIEDIHCFLVKVLWEDDTGESEKVGMIYHVTNNRWRFQFVMDEQSLWMVWSGKEDKWIQMGYPYYITLFYIETLDGIDFSKLSYHGDYRPEKEGYTPIDDRHGHGPLKTRFDYVYKAQDTY